jgi:menaquinone reductase, iron-sulfur cluster-binding subunit
MENDTGNDTCGIVAARTRSISRFTVSEEGVIRMANKKNDHPRYGMVIDLDKCNGCGACAIACAVENNLQPATPKMTFRTGNTWMRVYDVENGESFPENKTAFIPVMCQQCDDHAPCISVCPQNAVEFDPMSGIVAQIPERCFGCRYCMAACPYQARYFNWWDPEWPAGMEKTLNPDVSPRMRGVAEKCNFCHGRWQAARAKAAAEGRRELRDGEYIPACAESCPTGAITFGDLNDPDSRVSKERNHPDTFRILAQLGTEPKVYYKSKRSWIRRVADHEFVHEKEEVTHG